MVTELSSSSSRFIWKIDNFSKLDAQKGLYSDVIMVGGFKWKAQVYPKGYEDKVYDHLSVFLFPDDPSEFPYEANFSVAIISQTNSSNTVRFESKYTFTKKHCSGWGEYRALRLSELYDPDKGYIVNDSCVIKFEVSCRMNKDLIDNDIKESDLVSDAESNMEIKPKDGNSSAVDIGEHLAGKPFAEGRHNIKGGFCEGGEYEDIGGFSIWRTQASLYKLIWLKFGHIPSTKVVPISSYYVLVTAVKDLMSSVIDMHQCRFVELSTERIEVWEEKIEMAEKLGFNTNWLREQFETVKKGVCEMQKFKSELLEHGQPLRTAISKMKAIGDETRKAEAQLIAAKNYVRKNVSILLSEQDIEIYLEMGENHLFDGLF